MIFIYLFLCCLIMYVIGYSMGIMRTSRDINRIIDGNWYDELDELDCLDIDKLNDLDNDLDNCLDEEVI